MGEQADVGSVDEFPPGSVNLVTCGDDAVALFNVAGRFYAISDTCSHGEASLSEGDVYGLQVECPWHFGRFDLTTGKACKFPARKPIESYAVEIQDGRVFVRRTAQSSGRPAAEGEAVA